MEMRFFWVGDQVKRQFFDVRWHPGQENLADYFMKHFESNHHQNVRPWYLHHPVSPLFLPRAAAPSTLRGCVGTLPNGYMRSAPLPRIPHTRPNRVPNGQSTRAVRPSVRTYKPAAVWPMNNRTAMLANSILGHRSNRLIID